MKIKTATTIFEVLASEVRLSIFRLLVKYAPEGLVAGEISQMLDIPKTNLSFHLKNIMYSGLVSMEREGRNTRYRANIPLMLETIAYLASECCSGNSAHCQPYLAEGGIEPEFLSVYCQKQTYDTEITTMDTADKTKSSEDVKETVRAGYAAIATGQRSCCCPSQRGSQADPARLAAAVGYDAESLAKLPDGANMGLSCGNPVAIAALREGQTVVDLGSGGGFDVFQAGERVKASGRVIGVDMTPEMLAKARKNIGQYRQRTGRDNVEFRLGEIECLPVPDNSVDVVLSNCVINLSPDKPKVWREIYRVLKYGGKVSVSDLALLKPLPDTVRDMAAALVGCVAGAVLVEETKALLEKAPEYDYMISAEAKGIPLIYEMARQSGQNKYFLARKAPKLYMSGVFDVKVNSITTAKEQHLYLDKADAELMRGKRILIVDDVISTGESLAAVEKLVEEAGGIIAGRMAILAEGDAQNRDDIIYLEKLPVFHADGTIKE